MRGALEPTFRNPASRAEGPGRPWNGRTMVSVLQATPDRSDLVCGSGVRLSTADLRAAVRATAGWLRERGVERRGVVAWQLPNGPDAVVLYHATWWLGALAVPFHEQLTLPEISRVLELTGGADVVLASVGGPAARHPGAVLVSDGWTGSMPQDRGAPEPDALPGDPAVVLTTSGSSGVPKSVLHSQRSLAYKALQLPVLHGTTMADAVLVPAPLAHAAGLLHAVQHTAGAGVKAVIMAKWDPEQALDAVRDERITMLFGPPIFALGIAGSPRFTAEAVRSVRLISSGGTTITESFVRTVSATFGAVVKRTYGSTEAPVVCTTLPDDPVEMGWMTDGRAVPAAELQLRDEAGTVVGPSGEGELWVRGPELCDGYLDREQTEETFVGGWMRTRDLARIDEAGFVTIEGRISGFIIRGGMNISAREVEAALERHPDIDQAVVLGMADPLYGERVVAFVATDRPFDRTRCIAWFAELGVAKYKVPDRIERIGAIPVLATYQKPDHAALRALL